MLPGDRGHRGVVGTEFHGCDLQVNFQSSGHRRQLVSESLIGGNSAPDAQSPVLQLLQSEATFFNKDIDSGGLKRGGEVGHAIRWRFGQLSGAGHAASRIEDGRFQA